MQPLHIFLYRLYFCLVVIYLKLYPGESVAHKLLCILNCECDTVEEVDDVKYFFDRGFPVVREQKKTRDLIVNSGGVC